MSRLLLKVCATAAALGLSTAVSAWASPPAPPQSAQTPAPNTPTTPPSTSNRDHIDQDAQVSDRLTTTPPTTSGTGGQGGGRSGSTSPAGGQTIIPPVIGNDCGQLTASTRNGQRCVGRTQPQDPLSGISVGIQRTTSGAPRTVGQSGRGGSFRGRVRVEAGDYRLTAACQPGRTCSDLRFTGATIDGRTITADGQGQIGFSVRTATDIVVRAQVTCCIEIIHHDGFAARSRAQPNAGTQAGLRGAILGTPTPVTILGAALAVLAVVVATEDDSESD